VVEKLELKCILSESTFLSIIFFLRVEINSKTVLGEIGRVLSWSKRLELGLSTAFLPPSTRITNDGRKKKKDLSFHR
jgi:hypothetical protein